MSETSAYYRVRQDKVTPVDTPDSGGPTTRITNVSGRVLDTSELPISGATVAFGAKSARTDGSGDFALGDVDPTVTELIIDGTTANTRTDGKTWVAKGPWA